MGVRLRAAATLLTGVREKRKTPSPPAASRKKAEEPDDSYRMVALKTTRRATPFLVHVSLTDEWYLILRCDCITADRTFLLSSVTANAQQAYLDAAESERACAHALLVQRAYVNVTSGKSGVSFPFP